MSYKLEKPYTDKDYAHFVAEHNHRNGRKIEITETCVYALEKNELLDENQLPKINLNYEAEQAESKRQYYDNLHLTRADVERAIYKVKGMDFDDILAFITENFPEDLDIKALKIELKANNFYRGNPYVNKIGQILGFTREQLDNFFVTNDYLELK